MARPTNRYARAQARARYRKPKRPGSSLGWNIAIGVIVILGVAGIVVSRSGGSSSAEPKVGEHWHAQFGVFDCQRGDFIPSMPEFEERADGSGRAGVHTHGDGFIHIHPFASDEAGENATINNFFGFGGYDISDESMELWDGVSHSNGDACGDGRPGQIRWAVNGEEKDGDPGDYRPKDGDQIVIAFLPEGDQIPPLPAAQQTQD